MTGLELRSAELDLLLEEIVRESGGELSCFEARRIGGLATLGGPGRARSEATLERAEVELVRVHRGELAFLLREGARRCERWTAAEAAEWRTLVIEALAAACADDLDFAPFVPACLVGPPGSALAPHAAPLDRFVLEAVGLARASLRLAEHPLGRLELGLALQRRGRPREASGVLAAALHGLAYLPGLLQARPWPALLGGLARAQERSGHPERAQLLRRWLPGRVA